MVRPAELLKLGEKLLDRGDIAAARLALERAATGGNAQGALKLAMTFDQFFLGEWGTVGTLSDEVKAREWYDRAMTLGATEASQHLDRLPRKPY
jgi:TPR repeat protein